MITMPAASRLDIATSDLSPPATFGYPSSASYLDIVVLFCEHP